MELLVASQEPDEFRSSDFDDVREPLADEFGDDGRSTRIVTAGVADAEVARRRTRIRGVVRSINGSR
jgi:hypothetical protein